MYRTHSATNFRSGSRISSFWDCSASGFWFLFFWCLAEVLTWQNYHVTSNVYIWSLGVSLSLSGHLYYSTATVRTSLWSDSWLGLLCLEIRSPELKKPPSGLPPAHLLVGHVRAWRSLQTGAWRLQTASSCPVPGWHLQRASVPLLHGCKTAHQAWPWGLIGQVNGCTKVWEKCKAQADSGPAESVASVVWRASQTFQGSCFPNIRDGN